MEKIVSIFTKVPTGIKRDDDNIDRLSHRYTVMLLIMFTIVISSQLYIGKPITCWADKHFTGNHIKYTNAYCWVRNTYYLPFDEEIPQEHEHEKRDTIVYYQWLPFILLGQAFLFFAPSAVWHGLNQRAGVDCDNILEAAGKMQEQHSKEKRDNMRTLVVNQMDRFLTSRREVSSSKLVSAACVRQTLVCCGSRMGNYLVVLYLLTKLLYLVNAVGQLYMLNLVLRTSYALYGYEFMQNVIQGDHWMDSPTFPRVTMCDFKIRRLGNVHRYTVQCVLPINMYTEKIYAFMWFWMMMVAVVTGISLFIWIMRIALFSDRLSYITKHIPSTRRDKHSKDRELASDFITKYLRQDGVFVLRLIGHNTNNITVTEITEHLFENWKKDNKKNEEEPLDEDSDDYDPDTGKEPSAPPLPEKPKLNEPMYPPLMP